MCCVGVTAVSNVHTNHSNATAAPPHMRARTHAFCQCAHTLLRGACLYLHADGKPPVIGA